MGGVYYPSPDAEALLSACKGMEATWCTTMECHKDSLGHAAAFQKSAFIASERIAKPTWSALFRPMNDDNTLNGKIFFCEKLNLNGLPAEEAVISLYLKNACRIMEVLLDNMHSIVKVVLWDHLYPQDFHRRLEDTARTMKRELRFCRYTET